MEALKSFLRVEIDEVATHFVICKKCSTLIQYIVAKGTTGVLKHYDKCSLKNTPKQSILPFTRKRKLPDKVCSLNVYLCYKRKLNILFCQMKSDMAHEAVKFCCADLRPISTVNGHGFRDFCQKLINVGAEYGQVNVDEVVPLKNAVSEKISTAFSGIREKMKEDFKKKVNI